MNDPCFLPEPNAGMTITVDAIRRLDIKPGETLVVRLPGIMTSERVAEIHRRFVRSLPDHVSVLCIPASFDLTVVTDTDIPDGVVMGDHNE